MKTGLVGGTGFIGSYIVDRLLDCGHTPRLLVRKGSEQKIRQPQRCETIQGAVTDPDALTEMIDGCDALIYLIGILRDFPERNITFEDLQYRGFERCLSLAQSRGIRRVILMSANGIEQGNLPYQRSKRRAEELLEHSGTDWTIFRPSVVFGDPRGRMEFSTQLKKQLIEPPIPATIFFPGLNVASAGLQPMSPVHVENVAQAFVVSLDDKSTFGQRYVLAGPDTLYWKNIIRIIAIASGKSGKIMAPVPAWGVRLVAKMMQGFEWFPLTTDQIDMLMQGNVGESREIFDRFGIIPLSFNEKNLGYLAPDTQPSGGSS